MIATPLMALEAMAAEARALGLAPLILGDALEGEAREVGTVLAGIALGSATGGKLADRYDPRGLVGPALVLGGALAWLWLRSGAELVGPRSDGDRAARRTALE